MHELKLIVDLMYRGGLNFMRFSVSDTAEFGDYVSGPRIIDDHVRQTMRKVLADIQDGAFAARWIAENESGKAEFLRMRQADQDHQIEQVGAELRAPDALAQPGRGHRRPGPGVGQRLGGRALMPHPVSGDRR